MDSITVPRSVFVNGQWATAHWMADVVDESTGELVITATLAGVGDQGPVVTALRMDMALAQELRAMAGFGDGSGESDGGECYDCRTTGEHLESLEGAVTSLHEHQVLDARRVTKLEEVTALHNQRLNAVTKRLADLEARVMGVTTALGACASSGTVHAMGQRLAFIERTLEGRTGPEAGL